MASIARALTSALATMPLAARSLRHTRNDPAALSDMCSATRDGLQKQQTVVPLCDSGGQAQGEASMGSHAATEVQVDELSEQEAAELFDRICRREMGVSGTEFLRRWDTGDFAGVEVDSVPGLPDVVMALPMVREV